MPKTFRAIWAKHSALIVILAVLVGLGTAWLAWRQSNKTWELADNPYVMYDRNITARIGAYAPYAFMDKGGILDGYVIDLTNAISRVMSARIVLVSRRLDDPTDYVGQPDTDAVLCMVKTPATSVMYDFSPPYATHNFAIFGRVDSPRPEFFEARRLLEDPRFVLNADGVYYDLNRSRGQVVRAGLESSAQDAMQRVAQGDYDYTILETYIGNKIMDEQNLSNMRLIVETDQQVEYAFAVQKGNTEALKIFTEGLAYLQSSGQFERIQQRWLDKRYLITKSDRDSIVMAVAAGLFVTMAVMLIFFLWSHVLKRQVGERTAELEAEIVERKKTEKQLRRSQAQLIQADKMAAIGTLASGVAHEVNNPNGLIMLNMGFMREFFMDLKPMLDKKYQEDGDFELGGLPWSILREQEEQIIEDTIRASERIKNIVEELKEFVRVDVTGNDETFDLNEVTRAALRLMDQLLRKSTDYLEVELAPGLPPISGSGQKIEQVIVNLLVNACQALNSRDDKIAVKTEYLAESGQLRLQVIDTGRGIKPEHQPYLFDPFFTSKREEGGTGLGLSISDTIVKAHQGSLSLSMVDGRTVAELLVPVHKNTEKTTAQTGNAA